MQKVFWTFVAIFILIGIIAAGIYREQKEMFTSSAGKPIVRIGVIYPLSGDAATFGKSAQIASEIFLENLNKNNPVFDYKIVFEDNQHKAAHTVLAARKLIDVNKVDVLLTLFSDPGFATQTVAEERGVIHVGVGSEREVARGFYNFMAIPSTKGEVQLLHETLLKKGAKRVDVVAVNSSGTESSVKFIKEIFSKESGVSLGDIHYINPNEKDFRILLMKIKQNKPDYIIGILTMPSIDIFLRQYHQTKTKIPFTTIRGFSYLQNKELAEGMWSVDAPTPATFFMDEYKKRTGDEMTNHSEFLYARLEVLAHGYEGSKCLDKKKVIDYILKNTQGFKTVLGAVDIDAEGVIEIPSVLKKVQNNQLVTAD